MQDKKTSKNANGIKLPLALYLWNNNPVVYFIALTALRICPAALFFYIFSGVSMPTSSRPVFITVPIAIVKWSLAFFTFSSAFSIGCVL